MTQQAVLVDQLSKTYTTRFREGLFKRRTETVTALKNVSLEIKAGEIFGLLGPNGAGKTTLIKCLATLLIPTEGNAWINGYHILREDNLVRESIGCMLMGDRSLYWKLTGIENLMFFGTLYRIPTGALRQRVAELIEQLRLKNFIERPVETYSSGQKMKLAFAKTLLHDAPILILDEPTNTLDVPSARELRDLILTMNRQHGKTIIYTTHNLVEAEQLCERVAIVDQGQVIAQGYIKDLKRELQSEQVIRFEGFFSATVRESLPTLPRIRQVGFDTLNGHERLTVVTDDMTETLPNILSQLQKHGAVIKCISPESITLEDVFVALTGRSPSQPEKDKDSMHDY